MVGIQETAAMGDQRINLLVGHFVSPLTDDLRYVSRQGWKSAGTNPDTVVPRSRFPEAKGDGPLVNCTQRGVASALALHIHVLEHPPPRLSVAQTEKAAKERA